MAEEVTVEEAIVEAGKAQEATAVVLMMEAVME